MTDNKDGFEAKRVSMMERHFKEWQEMNAYHDSTNASFGKDNVPQSIKDSQTKEKALLSEKFLNETRDLMSSHFDIDPDKGLSDDHHKEKARDKSDKDIDK
ncbi:MAG: hypothetical protein RIF33_17865 [Cyclobacteriaceae bacterium]